MKIEQLTVENFKCFKREQTFDFSRLTILTGANSSGKSSVIYALLSTLQTEGFPFEYSTNGKYVNLGDYKDIVNQHNVEKEIKINIKSGKFLYETKWIEDKQNFLPTLSSFKISDTGEKWEKEYFGRKYINFYIDFSEHIKNAPSYEFKKFDFSDHISKIYNFMKNTFNQTKLKVSEKDNFSALFEFLDVEKFDELRHEAWGKDAKTFLIDPFLKILDHHPDIAFLFEDEEEASVSFISAFRQSPQRTYLEKNKANFKINTDGEGYIDQIVEWDKRSNGKIKQLISSMKELDLIDDIKIKRLGGGRFEVSVKPVNSNDFSALNDVGSGVSAFMPIMVADLQLDNSSTLFLAEPEIHLHPSVQAKFIDYIIHQINTTDKNYVIETHSEYFLNRIRLAIVKKELKKEDVKVYFLENTKEDTNVFDVDFTETGAIKNAPRNFFETYSIDVMDIALNAFAE